MSNVLLLDIGGTNIRYAYANKNSSEIFDSKLAHQTPARFEKNACRYIHFSTNTVSILNSVWICRCHEEKPRRAFSNLRAHVNLMSKTLTA